MPFKMGRVRRDSKHLCVFLDCGMLGCLRVGQERFKHFCPPLNGTNEDYFENISCARSSLSQMI